MGGVEGPVGGGQAVGYETCLAGCAGGVAEAAVVER